MKTLIICHEGDYLSEKFIPRWLNSFSHPTGIIVLREKRAQFFKRIYYEIKRSGIINLLDVFAFRLYYSFFISKKDKSWLYQKIKSIANKYPQPHNIPILYTYSPNTSEARNFIREHSPDMMIALCKILIEKSIFSIPSKGTFVIHPGICPEYRNSHGCFWALYNNQISKVGATLLKIDEGIDTGPVYGYYTCKYDGSSDSHIVIQQKAIFQNLEKIKNKLIEIYRGSARVIDSSGRKSAVWGQPSLTKYLIWKNRARGNK